MTKPRCKGMLTKECVNKGLTEQQCSRMAEYIVDGKFLCRTHAAMRALNIMLKSRVASRIRVSYEQ